MPILKKGFQAMRQILRALGYTNSLENLETKQQGVPGGGAPRTLTKKKDFSNFFD